MESDSYIEECKGMSHWLILNQIRLSHPKRVCASIYYVRTLSTNDGNRRLSSI